METRLAALEHRSPEWRSLLALLRATAHAQGDLMLRAPLAVAVDPDAPLLQGQALHMDTERLARLMHRLAHAAAADAEPGDPTASLAGYRPSGRDAVRLVEGVVRQDRSAADELAAAVGMVPEALAIVAQFAALPLLHTCGRQLQDRVPAHWPRGYCPICAGWPILAELRGLDRSRWLRCGRCGGAWQFPWLRCPFCGETRHERLGSLVPEQQLETRKIETCASCRGYLKSVTTLQATPPFELLLLDLETVELDLVAVDGGYARPQEPGYPLVVRITG
ncbi:MAG: formate dehydrogenase accessory protein FdhE [Gemmatimonadetes bacterium]|nr:formate dehydrogenase accessory protein FdhE [Gemmatimonadota bacterium]